MMQWNTQVGNITTNLKIKVDFTLLALSAVDVVTWNFHVDESTKGMYDMILVRVLFAELGINIKFSELVTEADDVPFNGSTTPIVDLGTHIFKYLNIGKITPEECFTNDYVKEVYESDHELTATKRLRVILDSKYEKSDLQKVMEHQCQHLIMTQRNELLKLLQKFEEFIYGTLGNWKTDPVEFELK